MRNRSAMGAFSVALCLLAPYTALGADYDKVIEERKALMKANSSDNKALRAAAKEGDMAEVEKLARQLASNFGKIADPALFPKGSGEGSRAKEAVWENWPEFEEAAQKARKLALAVAAQAKSGMNQEVMASASSLGKQACGSCHQEFRKPKKKN